MSEIALMKFEFIVDGPPVSQQTRRRERLREWKVTVRREAEKYWTDEQKMFAGLVMLQVTYFFDNVEMDVDNIVKPIQDELAYADDKQISDILVRKRSLFGKFQGKGLTPILEDGIARGNDFIYIVVTEAPDQEVLA
jgi:Holliday junction resolvase RusA-like endonuclease